MFSTEHALTRACTLLVLGAGVATAHAQAEPTPSEQVAAAQAAAQESAVQTSDVTIALIQELVKQGIIPLERAKALLAAAEREAALARQRQEQIAPPAGTVRVPYVPESVKNEMRAELRKEIASQAKEERWGTPGALPDWLGRLSWDGDFRLREQGEFFD